MAITMVKIRATIKFGGVSVSTPHILSFNVDKARGQISSFSASLKIPVDSIGNFSGNVVSIEAGTLGGLNKIYTGIIRNVNIAPCHDDPAFVIVNISGNDILSRLQGKKYTRRCRVTSGTWVSIQNVVRKGLKTPSFNFTTGGHYFDISSGDIFQESKTINTVLDTNPLQNVASPSNVTNTPGIVFEISPEEPKN